MKQRDRAETLYLNLELAQKIIGNIDQLCHILKVKLLVVISVEDLHLNSTEIFSQNERDENQRSMTLFFLSFFAINYHYTMIFALLQLLYQTGVATKKSRSKALLKKKISIAVRKHSKTNIDP